MMEVIEVLDGTETYDRCIVGLRECNDQALCPVHDSFKSLRERLKGYLSRTTVAQLVTESERKRDAAKRARQRKAAKKMRHRRRS